MNVLTDIFKYFSLIPSLFATISAIQSIIASRVSGAIVSGEALASAIEPALLALGSVLSHVNVPAALVTDICAAIADVMNTYFNKKGAPVSK